MIKDVMKRKTSRQMLHMINSRLLGESKALFFSFHSVFCLFCGSLRFYVLLAYVYTIVETFLILIRLWNQC